MKKFIVQCFIVLSFVVQGYTQSWNLLFDDDVLVNPVTLNLQIDLDFHYATTSSVPDQSGNSRTLTLTNTPTLNTASINGYNTITFNGTDEYGSTAAFTRNQPHTIYLVCKMITTGNSLRVTDGLSTQYTAITNIVGPGGPSIYAGSHVQIIIAIDETNWFIWTGVFNGVSSYIRFQSAANDNNASGNVGASNASGLRVGASGGTPAGFANVEIARILCYSGAHDLTTRTLVQNYLNKKYKIY